MNNYLSDYFLELNSCGRQVLSDRDYTRCRENGRADYHILYITNGRCFAEADGRELTVTAGQMILFRPYEKQLYRFYAKDETVSCYIHFSGTECETLLNELGLCGRVMNVGSSHTLDKLFSEMRDEYILRKPFRKQVCAALLLRFLAHAGRHIKYSADGIDISCKKRMDEVCAHMRKHYKDSYSVEFYADMCALSVDRFYHVFKQSVGIAPKKYILQSKIKVACDLLQNTDLSVGEIADEVGISDRSYFTKLIKRYTGHTPSYFRT